METKSQKSPEHDVHDSNVSNTTMNQLRAAVLGANDGIISVASIVVGVAGALTQTHVIFISGIAGLLAGAFSMAAGEYVSVSSQRDAEQALLAKERGELEMYPDEELEELTCIYQGKGLSRATAERVAHELTEHNAFHAHADAELGIDPHDLTNAWHAAIASLVSFTIGGIVPLVAILLPPANLRIGVTFAAVLVALILTGIMSTVASGSKGVRATARIIVGGMLAMAVTYAVGTLFGVAV